MCGRPSLAAVGDVDADGFFEWAVGAPDATTGGAGAGHADVFDLDRTGTPPRVVRFGRGCTGTAGRVLRIDHVGRPFLGGAMRVLMRGAQPLKVAFYTLAPREDVPLDPFGYPGCSAYALNDSVLFATFTSPTGTAAWTTFVPAVPALAGIHVSTQWIAADPAANAGGATTSDALELTLGIAP